jgi:hypothetical protein
MSTMLYHENPPLRNEAPADLATTSPMPGRRSKVSELCWSFALLLYTTTCHEDMHSTITTTTHDCRQSASYHVASTIGFIILPGQSLDSVLPRSGQDGNAIASSGFPGLVFCWPRRTSPAFATPYLDTHVNSFFSIQTHPKSQSTSSKMSSPLSSDIPKPYGSTEKLTRDVNRAFALPVPAFGDLSKAANDVRIREPLPLRILSFIDRALTHTPAYQQGLLPHLPGLAIIGRKRKRNEQEHGILMRAYSHP